MRNFHVRRPVLVVLTAGLALILAACGGGDDPTIATDDGAAPANGVSAEHNDADIAFVRDMIPHHEGAISMAELASTRAASAEVKDLATRIAAAQDPEIERMQAMAEAWGVDLSEDAGMEGMDHSSGGMEMGDMDADVAALEPLSGAEFDREFLTRMIAHHEGAVEMAQAELDQGVNPQAKELAQTIISVQNAEIEEMRGLVGS